MIENNFKTRLKALDKRRKVVLAGSFLALISVFMPWYSDIDRFKTGDTFLGITGPLYLAGIIVFLAGALSFGLIMIDLLEKPKPKMPMTENHTYIFSGAMSLLMLVIASSVYFNAHFGVNLTDKNMGIGMILGFIGSIGVLGTGIWITKKADINYDEDGELKPLIDLNVEDRGHAELERIESKVGDAVSETMREEVVQGSISDFEGERNTNDLV